MIDIFINRAPRLGLFTFDAVLSTTTQGSVKLTQIPLESGAEVNDHRIRNPNTYSMTGAVSNSPLKVSLDDILSLGLNVIGSITQPGGASDTAMNIGSSYLAGSAGARSSTSASLLFALKDSGDPITVVTGLMTLRDMVIADVLINQDPTMDDGFTFTAQLQEYMYIKSLNNESPVSEMDPSVQESASPDSMLGQAATQKVSNQIWADDAIGSIEDWTGGVIKSDDVDLSLLSGE